MAQLRRRRRSRMTPSNEEDGGRKGGQAEWPDWNFGRREVDQVRTADGLPHLFCPRILKKCCGNGRQRPPARASDISSVRPSAVCLW